MYLEILTSDSKALAFVYLFDPQARLLKAKTNSLLFESTLGGPKTMGIVSAPTEQMPKKGKRKNRPVGKSLFTLSTADEVKQGLIPKSLSECDFLLAINLTVQIDAAFMRETQNDIIANSRVELPPGTTGRGGNIVFSQMPWQRILVQKERGPDVSGLTVNYGTSDLSNVFELLQALKLGHVLGLPVVFDTYASAHNWAHWWSNMLRPSLALLGEIPAVEIPKSAKYSWEVVPIEYLKTLGISPKVIQHRKRMPLWKLYQHALERVGKRFLKTLGFDVPFSVVQTEDFIKTTGLWNKDGRVVATEVEQTAGHPVGAFNSPTGLIRSNELNKIPTGKTVGDLHEIGWWLAGAPLYNNVYHHGATQGVVVMIKDSSAGDVHRLAIPHLTSTESKLYVAPAGLFRLPAEGQQENWSIDPLVFLELFHRWGAEKSADVVRQIWTAMEVPLAPEQVGKQTIATISKEGITIVRS